LTITEKREVPDGFLKSGPNKGLPKIVKETYEVKKTVLVDFKSNPFGKESKSFFDAHMYQLIATKKAMMQNFGIHIEELYNWSPDNWRNEPKYTFHKWNVKPEDEKLFDKFEELAEMQGFMKPDGKIRVYPDTWNAENPDVTMFHTYTYEEYVLEVLNK